MNNLAQLLEWKSAMRETFTQIQGDPLNINKLIEHVAKLSKVVDGMISTNISERKLVHQAHMDALRIPEISVRSSTPRPQVHNTVPWEAIGPTIRSGSGIDLSQVPYDQILCWSDTHFFQQKIIEYTGRPFTDVGAMHEALIANYNSVVKPTDVVLWVGDISFAGVAATDVLLNQCNGYKILVVGNHDLDRHNGKLKMMAFDEIHTSLLIDNIVVTHHPWKEALPEGMWNVHGHLHNHVLGMDRHTNVCVEQLDYTPRTLQDLLTDSGYYG